MTKTLSLIFGIGLLIVAFYGIITYQGLKKTELHNTAIDECGKIASSVKPGEFIQFIYNLCLTDKNITK